MFLLFSRNAIVISKEKYEQLLHQSIDLAKQKILVQKLKESIGKKCLRLKELNKIISKHKYLFKKKEQEKKLDEAEKVKSEQTKKRKQCTVNLYCEILIESVHIEVASIHKIVYFSLKEQKQVEILECLRFGNQFKKYSPTVRTFCFTLHYYSPKAYDYVRTIFNNNLPPDRTLRYWMSSVDSSPGFTECAFDALEKEVEEAKKKEMDLTGGVVFDEMFIRRQSQYDKAKKEFFGHISAGKPVEYDEFSPLAKDALLLMFCGINTDFKISIGYFLTCGLCTQEKVAILDEAMRKLSKTGITLASMTSDGFKANIAAYKKLGANFKEDKPYFLNPYKPESRVYVLLDPPHMIKLIRNCIARFKEKGIHLFDSDGNEISFRFIEKLVNLQIEMGINLGNKLTKTHAEFQNVKMKVRYAAQTICARSAASIEFLDQVMKHEEFANSTGTTVFFRTFGSLFNIMNIKKGHTDNEWKQPIGPENISRITQKFSRDQQYIKGLTIIENEKRVAVLNTDSYTPFFGFYHNMTSFLGMYHDYVAPQSSGIKEFYTFSVSQDHVECTFGCVRQMGGNNCNPNAQQFGGAYRKLLVQNEVTSSNYANCRNDVTAVLDVSSGRKNLSASSNDQELQTLEDFKKKLRPTPPVQENKLKSHSKAYLASELERKVQRKIQLKRGNGCSQCLDIFNQNEKMNDVFVQFISQHKEIVQPCKSTMQIITFTDNLLEKYDSLNISYPSMLAFILEQVISSMSLFQSTLFGKEHNHKQEFVKLIIETYLDTKSENIGRLVTRLSQKKLLRHHYLKEVHREGQ